MDNCPTGQTRSDHDVRTVIRRCLVFLVVLTAPLLAAGTGAHAQMANVDCDNRVTRVVFWPDGSPATATRPASTASYVEVYRGSSERFRLADLIAYADVERVSVAKRCNVQGPRYHLKQMSTKRRSSGPVALECVLTASPVINVDDLSVSTTGRVSRRSLSLRGSDRYVLYANVGTADAGPLIQYDARVCREIDAPTWYMTSDQPRGVRFMAL